MAKIILYTGYYSEPWNARSIYQSGMGGTETAITYLSGELANIGHQVMVVGDNIISENIDGVQFLSSSDFHQLPREPYDVVIGVSYLHYVKEFVDNNHIVKEFIFWQHNTEPFLWYKGEQLNQDDIDYIYSRTSRIWVPSVWAKKCIPRTYQGLCDVIPNGINPIELKEVRVDKFDNLSSPVFMYSSCASRGLSEILDVWPILRTIWENATLHIAYPQYSPKVAGSELIEKLNKLNGIDGIKVHGTLSKSDLYDVMAEAHFWLYPTDYEETFCITALEMISNGVIPIISNVANLQSFAEYCITPQYSDGLANKKSLLGHIITTIRAAQVRHDLKKFIAKSSNKINDRFDWRRIGEIANNHITNNHVLPIQDTPLVDMIYLITSNWDALNSSKIPGGVVNELRSLGLKSPLQLMPAFDGRAIDRSKMHTAGLYVYPNWQINSTNGWWNRDITNGEIGCTLAHLNCWYHAFKHGYKRVIILEDDFKCNGIVSTKFDFNSIPDDTDLLYLGRNLCPQFSDTTLTDRKDLVKPGFSYNTHAYLLTDKGVRNLLDYGLTQAIMPVDEFLGATYCKHPRADLEFIVQDVTAYAVEPSLIIQSDNRETTLTGFSGPIRYDTFKKAVESLNDGIKYYRSVVDGTIEYAVQHEPLTVTHHVNNENVTLFDYFTNRDGWLRKYVCSGVLSKEWDLIIDHPIPGVACLTMFKPAFCDEIVEHAEAIHTKKGLWTTARHHFYPTTDFVLDQIGFNQIYQDLIKDYILPAARHFYRLEGAQWNDVNSENFMAKYTPDSQAHLALHHDNADVTALINLSDPTDYVGGGTYFKLYDKTHIGTKGQLTLHPGRVSHVHGGRPIQSGSRYILVSFMTAK